MKITQLKSEDSVTLLKEIKSFYEEMDKFSSKIVEIHCALSKKTFTLNEFRSIQRELDELTSKFYVFNYGLEEKTKKNIIKLKCYEKLLQFNTIFSPIFLIIPEIGPILAILIALDCILHFIMTRNTREDLEAKVQAIKVECQIIKQNLDNKYAMLEKKLQEYASYSDTSDLDVSDNYYFYYANDMINNYLNGYDILYDEVDIKIINAMKYILKQELQTDCDDLKTLLEMAKRTQTTIESNSKEHVLNPL